eukprot:Seg1615.2 transcript_id=Seg1615.2/GoldUCD/mRNA.D3Y31 product="Katanin p80 WD40 repeat-containing subunit B1-like" protein_id=Seg1615.2/GoldUCD/D3Y31
MAMEKMPMIKDTHTKNITALAFNPSRHELLVGCEDGVIKAWDYSTGEAGKLVRTCHEHGGWITNFLYWSDAKMMLSASNDGFILAWGSGIQSLDRVEIGGPVYCMAWNTRRNQLVLGMNSMVKVYSFRDLSKDERHFINGTACIQPTMQESLACQLQEILRTTHGKAPGKISLRDVQDVPNNYAPMLSAGFDKVVKVWSQDGQLMHKFDTFSATITGLCYVRQTKTIWVSAGTDEAPMFDPKSGDNVSEFIGTFTNADNEPDRHELCLLQYVHDIGQVFATDSRHHILCWKYNPSGCITALRNRKCVESLTYTKKVPILIFSGDEEGHVSKWERLQSNTFMYSKEILLRSEAISKLASQITERHNCSAFERARIRDQLMQKKQPPSFAGRARKFDAATHANTALIKAVFVEDLDLLVVSSEDSNIYVWGFDEKAVEVLEQMRPTDDSFKKKFEILLQSNDNHRFKQE